MISNVSMNNAANYNSVEFAKKAMKYTEGQKIKEDTLGDELVSGVKGTTVFTTLMTLPKAKRIAWAIKHHGEYGDEFGKGVDKAYDQYKIIKGAKKAGVTVEEYVQNQAAQAAAQAAEATAQVAENAGKTGLLSKITAPVKNALSLAGEKTGLKKAGTFLAQKFPKVSKFFKGSGVGGFFLFNMAISGAMEVIPAFKQGGAKEGFKQLGRSIVRSSGDAVGFAAGMKLGSMLGTAICPGAGTVIGGLLGSALGMIIGGALSTIGSKAVDKTLGEDFSKQQAKRDEQAQAEQIANNPEEMNKLKEAVEQKIAEAKQSGKKKAIKEANEMEKLLKSLPEIPNTTNGTKIAFSAAAAEHAINNSLRLNMANQPQMSSAGIKTFAQTQPQIAQNTVQQPTVWVPRTVAEITSGLYDSNGNIKTPTFGAIA